MLFLGSLYVIVHHSHLIKVDTLMNLVMIVRVMESILEQNVSKHTHTCAMRKTYPHFDWNFYSVKTRRTDPFHLPG